MEYLELYDASVLDSLIGVALKRDKLGIKEFREILREYNRGELSLNEEQLEVDTAERDDTAIDESALTRDLDYYEENCGGSANAGTI